VRLTIDSNDNLDQVLKAVGALFGVQVTADGEPTATPETNAPARRRGGAKKAAAPRGRGRARATGTRAASRTSRPDSGAVRAWARSNGFDVSDRGRIPSAVISAYQEANRG
jgi:hypothetical protein